MGRRLWRGAGKTAWMARFFITLKKCDFMVVFTLKKCNFAAVFTLKKCNLKTQSTES